MAPYNDDRQWFTGNWKCSKCGKMIDRLPFQPDENRLSELKCKDCHREAQKERNGGFKGGTYTYNR